MNILGDDRACGGNSDKRGDSHFGVLHRWFWIWAVVYGWVSMTVLFLLMLAVPSILSVPATIDEMAAFSVCLGMSLGPMMAWAKVVKT